MGKRIFFVFVVVFLAVGVLAVFTKKLPILFKGNTPAKNQGPKTIKLWGLWENADITALLFDSFKNVDSTVSIEYEQRNSGGLAQYKDLVQTRLAEGTAPDVILVHASWIKQLLPYLSASPSFSAGDFAQSFYKSAQDVCVVSNTVVCVPPSYDGLSLIYNKDMFALEGLVDPPVTWDDLRVYARKLTKRDVQGTLIVSGVGLGSAKNVPYASDIFGLMLVQSGVKIPENLESEPATDVLAFYTSFVRDDKVWDPDLGNALELFARKRVAMVFAPSREIQTMLNASSSLNFAVASVPQIPLKESSGLTNANWSSFWVFVVPKTSTNQDVAWNLIKYVTSKQQQLEQYQAQSEYRSFGQIMSLVELKGEVEKSNILKPYVLSADSSQTAVIADKSGNDSYTDIITKAIDSVAGGADAKSTLTTAKSSITSLLSAPIKK